MQEEAERGETEDGEIGRRGADKALRRADAIEKRRKGVSQEEARGDEGDSGVEVSSVEQRLLAGPIAHYFSSLKSKAMQTLDEEVSRAKMARASATRARLDHMKACARPFA